jgi:hypothetical protein
MQAYDDLGLGWLAWSWNQNGVPKHDMMSRTAGWQYDSAADLSNFGKLVIDDATLGLKATSRPSTTLRPARIDGTAAAGATVYIDDNNNGALDAKSAARRSTATARSSLTNLPQGVHRVRVLADAAAPSVTVALPAGGRGPKWR